jgi:hypothetical protein
MFSNPAKHFTAFRGNSDLFISVDDNTTAIDVNGFFGGITGADFSFDEDTCSIFVRFL